MIREATQGDIPQIVKLISRSLVDGPYAGKIKDNPEQTAMLASKIIESLGKILLCEEDGKSTGLLAFIVLPHYMSGEMIADELAWYVEPEARIGGAALRLLWEAEKLAHEMGATRIKFSAPNQEVAHLYSRFGFKPIETVYVKELYRQDAT